MGTHSHRAEALKSLKIAVLSVSTTRDLASDASGQWIAGQIRKEGHQLAAHQVVDDDIVAIRKSLARIMAESGAQAVIVTGGTGVAARDVTIEAVAPLFSKELTSFGPVFAQLSFEQIDSAAILSRATAGVVGGSVVFCIPGSLKACKLACNELIFAEVAHIYKHAVE